MLIRNFSVKLYISSEDFHTVTLLLCLIELPVKQKYFQNENLEIFAKQVMMKY